MALDYFRAITGSLLIVDYAPDGDSVRFVADKPAQFAGLKGGYRIKPSKKDGSVQLRLEGIDAPETHYGSAAQPYGSKARDALLDLLGFDKLQFGKDGNTVTAATPTSVEATIFTKASDPHGRPISYLSAGHAVKDGAENALGEARLRDTVNYRMVANGNAYPLLYSSTPTTHRSLLRAAAQAARSRRKGLWKLDDTQDFKLVDQSSIGPQGELIFPKLFRRCTDYLRAAASSSVDYDLTDWLHEHASENDALFIEKAIEVCQDGTVHANLHLSNLIQQRNSHIAITADITEVVFIEQPV